MLHKITAPEGPDTLLWDTSILSSMAEVRSHCLNLPWVLLVIGRGCGDNRGNMWGVLLSPRTCLLSVSYLSVLKMNIGRVGRAWSAMASSTVSLIWDVLLGARGMMQHLWAGSTCSGTQLQPGQRAFLVAASWPPQAAAWSLSHVPKHGNL